MKTYTKESLIEALIKIREKGWIPTGRKNNDGGVGNTLEDLLGIEENNLPLPICGGVGIKSAKKGYNGINNIISHGAITESLQICTSIFITWIWLATSRGGEKICK